jgi:predicted membrane-bound mannosyltransferase
MSWLTNLIMPMWVRVSIIAVIFALIAGVLYGIYHAGELNERERNAKVENEKVAKYGQQVLDLQTKNRDLERASVIKVNKLTLNYEKRINDAKNKTESALRSVATGALKLRIATKNSAKTCGDTTAEAGTPATAVTESTAELSTEATGFLINLTSECDATVEKLNLCIDIATSDRKEILSNDTLNNELDD